MKRVVLVVSVIMVLVAALAVGAQAAPPAGYLLGIPVYAMGGEVEVTIGPSSSGYNNTLALYFPEPTQVIGLDDAEGTTVSLGSFAWGTELVFGINVAETGYTFYTGDASRNPDGVYHAAIKDYGNGTVDVWFEDIIGGGDEDYDDATLIRVKGATTVVPEASSVALAVMGLTSVGGFLIRKRK